MTSEPLISVITVTYNAEKEIMPTLKSLSSQDFKNFEHIVIDGDSKDKTIELIKKEKIPNSLILSEPDKGLYDAMNKGLRLARGKYVIFLNAGDTFFDSQTLSDYSEAALKDFDIIYGDTCIVDKEGEIIGKRHLSVPEKLETKSFSKGMLICHQAFMVKRELTESYDLKYRFSADYDWCIKCIAKTSPSKCHNVHKETVKFLQAGMSDKNKIRSLKERFRIMSSHYGFTRTVLNHIGFVARALKRGKL